MWTCLRIEPNAVVDGGFNRIQAVDIAYRSSENHSNMRNEE